MKSPELRPDTMLMTLIAQGDEQAFELLYDRYKSLVFGLVLNMVGDKSTAEDVLIDVFSQLWRHAITFQPGMASVRTWMMSVARHRAIDELRRRRTRLDQAIPPWAKVPLSTLADPDELEARFELHDLQTRVSTAIASLPTDQREALALAYFKGYSHRQIAETLNRPLGSVKTHIRKAMQQLRQQLSH